jgi:hypothetical protein
MNIKKISIIRLIIKDIINHNLNILIKSKINTYYEK